MSKTHEASDRRTPGARTLRSPRRVRTTRNIVLLSCIVVVVVVGFALLVGHLVSKPSPPATFGVPDIASVPAGTDFAAIDKTDALPANVLAALVVPAGSTVVAHTNHAIDAPFDGTVTYTNPASPAEIAQFFPAELAQEHWRVERSASPVLALIAGSDGNYWELGVTISPLSSSPSHPDGTQFKVELYTYEPGQ
jgi:hypothetical protein